MAVSDVSDALAGATAPPAADSAKGPRATKDPTASTDSTPSPDPAMTKDPDDADARRAAAPPSSYPATVAVTVRYFAAARAASGLDEETLQVQAPATVEAALRVAVGAHGADLERVLARCSFLLNEVAVHGRDAALTAGDQLDVLPPFAGG